MMDSANEDSVTKLNTQLNKSMVLMEDAVDMPSPNKRKSITINTEVQSSKAISSPVKSRKSILKKSNKSFSENVTDDEVAQTSNDGVRTSEATFNGPQSLPTLVLSRPRTVSKLFFSSFFLFL